MTTLLLQMILLICILVVGTTNGTTLDRRQDLPAVVFEKIDDFYLSHNSWLVGFTLEIEPYITTLSTVSRRMQYLKGLILSIHTGPLHEGAPHEAKFPYSITSQTLVINLQREHDLLVQYHHQIWSEVKRLQILLNSNDRRNPRALLPFLGSILKGLTGVADQNTIKNIRAEIRKVAQSGVRISHIVDEGITIINVTRTEVQKNRKM